MIVDPETIAEVLLQGAVAIHDRDGGVVPTSFAIGHARTIFAQPFDDSGLRMSREARIAMDALLISATGAVCLGRIDESYIQERGLDDPAPSRDELLERADVDPTIGTALTVQAMSTRSRKATVALARHRLSPEGESLWDQGLYTMVEGDAIVAAVEACAMAAGITNPISDEQLREELLNIGWQMIDSDDIDDDDDEESLL